MDATVLKKLYKEREELQAKIAKLRAFINESVIYDVLPQDQKDLLTEQLLIMNQYEDVLTRRVISA